jgi:GntR family transcriptional regulator, transcriptional repressor for pyruvate dehydrogenase complex
MAGTSKPSGKSGFVNVVRVSPTEQVRAQLMDAIERGDYGPGDALPSERALCEMLGVSRVSVREAIAGLEAMGVVTVQHGRGCFVTEGAGDRFAGPFGTMVESQRAQVVDLLKVRGALDELAAAEAARLGDPDRIAAIDEAQRAFRAAARDVSEDPEQGITELVAHDVAFHDAVAVASGSPLLARLIGELATHIDDSRRDTLSEPGRPKQSADQHDAILAAIQAGDPDAARREAAQHVAMVIGQVNERTAAVDGSAD